MRCVLMVCAIVGLASGCSVTVPLPYSPESGYELDGGAAVENFDYKPPRPLPSNQVRNTAVGDIFLAVPVGTHVANAVRKEFKYSWLSTKADSDCYVSGIVYDFALEDLGFSINYKSDIEYVISEKLTSLEIFRNRYKVNLRGAKGDPNTIENINKMLSENIGKFMADPGFQGLFPAKCKRPSK